jgi:protein TonB
MERFAKSNRWRSMPEVDRHYMQYIMDEYISVLKENNDNYRTQISENMALRIDTIVKLFLNEGDKMVIDAHTIYTNKGLDFDNNEACSMGYYLNKKYGNDYFSASFQVGEGSHTQDYKTVTQVLTLDIQLSSHDTHDYKTESLPDAPSFSFENSGLDTKSDYFYYPSKKIPEGISSLGIYTHHSYNIDAFRNCIIPKHLDALVFIRKSSPLQVCSSDSNFTSYTRNKRSKTEKRINILANRRSAIRLELGESPEFVGDSSRIWEVVEEAAEFPLGGREGITKYLNDNIAYSVKEKMRELKVRITVTFVVNKDGSISDIKIERGLGAPFDDEAIRVVMNMPKWKPARNNDKPVNWRFRLPIYFPPE